jgi:hypothetical protein
MATLKDPGGHHFVVLKASINKKPVIVSEIVSFDKVLNV